MKKLKRKLMRVKEDWKGKVVKDKRKFRDIFLEIARKMSGTMGFDQRLKKGKGVVE